MGEPYIVAHVRVYELWRQADVSGVSGTGRVALGCEFPDGTFVLRWLRAGGSTAVYATRQAAEAIHGHDGATMFVELAAVETP